MRLFFLIYLGLLINEKILSQPSDNTIKGIKTYVNKIDSLSDIKILMTTDRLVPVISEGTIENKKKGLKGGFSIETFTNPDRDTIYLIHIHDNLEKNLYQSYYFKSDKLVFSKIELQDDNGENTSLFLQEEYYSDNKIILSTINKDKLKKKYKWRTDFDPLTRGYFYYKDEKEISK